MRAAEDQLSFASSELEKQKVLNEKLETDLLAVEKQKLNGAAITPSDSGTDLLAGLDIGKPTAVSQSGTKVQNRD